MNAKRGFVPEDEKDFSPAALETLRIAAGHIDYLINNGYYLKQASVFVGNHFLLSERQRLAITRSLATKEQLKRRREKELADLAGGEAWIDGFNTIISLEVLLSNSVLFRGMDGTIRDLAALRGTYRIIPETSAAVRMMLDALREMHAGSAHILLDDPLSLDIRIMRDVDRALWEKENVISSDSIVLDHCKSWVNLVARCAEKQNVQPLQVWGKRAE